MNQQDVEAYVERSQTLIEASPQMDEANTKAAVLQSFLDLLDWEIPTNTQLEYSVKAFGQTYKVDYALVLEGTPVAFLEAKGVDTSLTADHEEQLSSYMMNKNVKYGILTNATEYRFFQRRVDSSNVSVRKVTDVPLDELPDKIAVLRAYTKDAVETGESKKILGRINDLRESRKTFENEKEEIAGEVAELLTNRVSDVVSSFAESQSKEMIDRLIGDIDAEVDADGRVEKPAGGTGGGDSVSGPLKNHVVGSIHRSEVEGKNDAKVAVFPTRDSGLPFLKENNAWGFVRVASEFKYVAMYVTGDAREVRYFASVKDVVHPDDADLERPPLEYLDRDEVGNGKMVVRFEPDSLYRLEDPIPYETKYPQSLQYTTLGALRTAETTDDLF